MQSKAWDRRENESAQAYEAFMGYLTQPAAERSTRDVARELGKSSALIQRWSSMHDWQERSRSFDGETERKAVAIAQKRQADKIAGMRSRHRRVGRRAIELACKALDRPDLVETMTLADAYRLMRGGLLLERSGFEQPTPQSIATSGDLADPLKTNNAASQQQATTMLRKLEIEVIGEGGKIVPASEIAAAMVSFYDKPSTGEP